jgi:hypothetical protein
MGQWDKEHKRKRTPRANAQGVALRISQYWGENKVFIILNS